MPSPLARPFHSRSGSGDTSTPSTEAPTATGQVKSGGHNRKAQYMNDSGPITDGETAAAPPDLAAQVERLTGELAALEGKHQALKTAAITAGLKYALLMAQPTNEAMDDLQTSMLEMITAGR